MVFHFELPGTKTFSYPTVENGCDYQPHCLLCCSPYKKGHECTPELTHNPLGLPDWMKGVTA